MSPAPIGLLGEVRNNGSTAEPVVLWPRMAEAAWCGLPGEIVQGVAPTTEADPVAMLLDVLVSFGNAAGTGAHARVGAAVHPPRLNVVLTGKTSRARKGQSRAEVRPLFDAVDPEWSSDRVMGGLASGEGVIAAVRDGSGDDDPGCTDKRLFIYEPEFSRVLGVAARDGNTLSAVVRECWDSGRLRVMTRKDPLVATGAHVSVLGHVTVEEIRRKLTDTDACNGFGNRFLWVLVRRAQLLPSGGRYTYPADQILRLRAALDHARRTTVVERSAAAEELWIDLYARMAEEDEAEGLAAALTSRAEAQVLRLSLIFALMDCSKVIEIHHLSAAWAVWEYAAESVRYIFGTASGDPIADKLLAAIVASGPLGLDLTEQSALFGRHQPAQRLHVARELLETRGLIRTEIEVTDGPSRHRSVSAN
jgi:Protein of unknown function (DUF3987)